jgi:hypothetical protein
VGATRQPQAGVRAGGVGRRGRLRLLGWAAAARREVMRPAGKAEGARADFANWAERRKGRWAAGLEQGVWAAVVFFF